MKKLNDNARTIFLGAIEIASDHDRWVYVEKRCGGDAELRGDVAELLDHHGQIAHFLESPPAGVCATIDQPSSEQPGTLIGRYKLLEQVGEGGMGVVYVAEQTEPVRRRVALKIIKPGMDTKQVIARFEAERQALAMMDHPNIARVLDAGTTEAGRPYFVMELVRGMPITDYCDKVRLSPRQRLELFIDVCQAVQHAHQKGIIHRDLKPSNVMVTTNDGRPVVKVIDFGVAKAVGQQLTERTVYTALTQLVGTPLYMSPEQAELTSNDVDTRSDVYSLGVLLYELLTGQTPFDKEALSKAGFDEMRRMIREDEPLRPSRRFSTLGIQAISTASQHRSVDERRLSKILCGELDWIVMKALEKDRSRRYESASALAADIQRYLSDEPVLACPPTTMYRFHKFARKHKPALATAAAIALCLILGTTVSAWQAVRATTAETQATANEAQAKEAAAAEAQQRERAQANEQKANEQRDEAQRQRDEVKALNDKLVATQAELRSTLYAAHMNMARHAWEAGVVDQMEELLAQHRPKPGETDVRGFEWYYLYRLCHGELLTLKGHTADISSVAYSPDGKRLASGSADSTVKVWDTSTGREILTFRGHSGGVRSVAFTPDGKRIASAGGPKPGELKIWDADSGRELFSLKGHSAVVTNVTFSSDGKRLASGHRNGAIKIWDAQSGEELISLMGHTEGTQNVVFSPDGKRLASAGLYESMKVWDVQTGQELLSKNTSGRVSFSPDGKRLTTGYYVMDAETGKVLHYFNDLINAQGLLHSPDGKRLAGTSGDKIIRIYDAESGQELFSLKRQTEGDALAFSPDSKHLALADEKGTVKIWDVTVSPESRVLTGLQDTFWGVAYRPDGKHVAASSYDGTLKIWSAQTFQEILTLKGEGTRGVAYSPDGSRLTAAGRIWNADTGEVIADSKESARSARVYSADGKRIASGTKVLDAQTGQEVLSLKGDTEGGTIKAFSPDGKVLATTNAPSPSPVKLWDAQTGAELFTLPETKSGARAVKFSPDSTRLVTASHGGVVRIWEVRSGRELLNLKGHFPQVNSVAFSPDGKRLATHSLYKTVKVWDVETGQDMLTLKSAFGLGIAFSPDGHQLAGAGENALKIWDATPLAEKP